MFLVILEKYLVKDNDIKSSHNSSEINLDKELIVIEDNITLGTKEKQYSYYSELGGLDRGLWYVQQIYKKFNILNCNIEVRCDSIEAIKVASRLSYKSTIVIRYFSLVTLLHY